MPPPVWPRPGFKKRRKRLELPFFVPWWAWSWDKPCCHSWWWKPRAIGLDYYELAGQAVGMILASGDRVRRRGRHRVRLSSPCSCLALPHFDLQYPKKNLSVSKISLGVHRGSFSKDTKDIYSVHLVSRGHTVVSKWTIQKDSGHRGIRGVGRPLLQFVLVLYVKG